MNTDYDVLTQLKREIEQIDALPLPYNIPRERYRRVFTEAIAEVERLRAETHEVHTLLSQMTRLNHPLLNKIQGQRTALTEIREMAIKHRESWPICFIKIQGLCETSLEETIKNE